MQTEQLQIANLHLQNKADLPILNPFKILYHLKDSML